MSAADDDLFAFGGIRRRFSDAELLADVQAFASVYGPRERTMASYRGWQRRRFHDHTICAQLGGWVEALHRAGVEHAAQGAAGPTAGEVGAEIRRFAKVTPVAGRTLAAFTSWPKRKVSAGAVKRHFVTWHAALTQLGIEVPGQSRSVKHSDEELLDAVERVWRFARRHPSASDFKRYSARHTDGISYLAVYLRFGRVRPFLEAFAEWKHGRMTKRDLLMFAAAKRNSRAPIPTALRYKVLQGGRSICVECGRSPDNTRGLIVHVDHKIPVSQGGSNDITNLQVLCKDCNLGKGPLGRQVSM
jgi:hypothetical protein